MLEHLADLFCIRLIVAEGLQIIVHEHGAHGDCHILMQFHHVSDVPVVLFPAYERVSAYHQRNAVCLFLHLALIYGPAEHIVGIDDFGQSVQIPLLHQRSHRDAVVNKNISVFARKTFIAVPVPEFDPARMARLPKTPFQLPAEIIRVRQIKKVVDDNRGLIFNSRIHYAFYPLSFPFEVVF